MTGHEFQDAMEQMDGTEITRDAYIQSTGRTDYEAFVAMFIVDGQTGGWLSQEFEQLARGRAFDDESFADDVEAYLLAR